MTFPEDETKEETPSPSLDSDTSDSQEEQPRAEVEPIKAGTEAQPSEDKKAEKSKKKVSEKPAKADKSDKGKKESKPVKKDKAKRKPAEAEKGPVEVPRLMTYYHETVASALKKRFNYANTMMVPRLEKIVLNTGVGEAAQNAKLLESAMEELAVISGQKPQVTRARKSISNFKLRKGMAIGCRVTLRSWRMWEFLDRLLNVAIPRIRDFRGVSDRSFDGRGNYSLGIREQIIFPEIDIDKIERVHGLDVTFVTTAKTDEEAYALLEELGMPFRRRPAQTSEQAA